MLRKRYTEYPETGALLSARLYELALTFYRRGVSTYSNMLFYGAIIGTAIIVKSIGRSRAEPRAFTELCVFSDYRVVSVTLSVEFVPWLFAHFS